MLPLDDYVKLLPLVSFIVAPLFMFIGEAGTIPPCEPEVAPAEGIEGPVAPF